MGIKKAMIFGVTGQDGSYLSELLLSKSYKVIGVARRSSLVNTERIQHLLGQTMFQLEQGDVTDATSVLRLLCDWAPDEVYNLAAQSHVKISFDEPVHTTNAVYGGCLNILEAIRIYNEMFGASHTIRFYQASSSEMFGASKGTASRAVIGYGDGNGQLLYSDGNGYVTDDAGYKQSETTCFLPCSPYAIAKLAAHHAVRLYRESYGIHASSGILFNHESERRGEAFVTKKIAKYVARLKHGLTKEKLFLGNLSAKRDWGHAEDYVRAMWLMLQQEVADDYVIATGETYSVEDFLVEAFAAVDIADWQSHVALDKALLRPSEVNYLCGDASKARKQLGWEPKVKFKELVKRMVGAEIIAATPSFPFKFDAPPLDLYAYMGDEVQVTFGGTVLPTGKIK